MNQIDAHDLNKYEGRNIVIECNGKQKELPLLKVKKDVFSVEVYMKGFMQHIECWYKIPFNNEFKIFVK